MSTLLNPEPQSYVKPRRVYVTNLGWHDYAPAERYGEVIPITEGNVTVRKTARLRARIIKALEDMQSDDLICLSGHPLIITEVIAVVMKKFGHVNYIFFDSLPMAYLKRETDGTVPERTSTNEEEDEVR